MGAVRPPAAGSTATQVRSLRRRLGSSRAAWPTTSWAGSTSARRSVGIWRYGAEPGDGDERDAGRLDGFRRAPGRRRRGARDRVRARASEGYLIASSQGDNSYVVYERGGENAFVRRFQIGDGDGIDGTEDTDGIDVTTADLGAALRRRSLRRPGRRQRRRQPELQARALERDHRLHPEWPRLALDFQLPFRCLTVPECVETGLDGMWVRLCHLCVLTVRGERRGWSVRDRGCTRSDGGRARRRGASRPRRTARLAVGHGGSGSHAGRPRALHPRALVGFLDPRGVQVQARPHRRRQLDHAPPPQDRRPGRAPRGRRAGAAPAARGGRAGPAHGRSRLRHGGLAVLPAGCPLGPRCATRRRGAGRAPPAHGCRAIEDAARAQPQRVCDRPHRSRARQRARRR